MRRAAPCLCASRTRRRESHGVEGGTVRPRATADMTCSHQVLTSRARMRRRQGENTKRIFFAGDPFLLYGSQIEIMEETENVELHTGSWGSWSFNVVTNAKFKTLNKQVSRRGSAGGGRKREKRESASAGARGSGGEDKISRSNECREQRKAKFDEKIDGGGSEHVTVDPVKDAPVPRQKIARVLLRGLQGSVRP